VAITLTELNRTLKRIEALLKLTAKQADTIHLAGGNFLSSSNTVFSDSNIVAELEHVNTELDTHTIKATESNSKFEDIKGKLDNINDSLNFIEADDDAIRLEQIVQTTALDDLNDEADTHTIKFTEVNSKLQDIKGKLDGVNSELDSIDDNWNLLSVNSVAVVATALNTTNNATTGKQDTSNTHLGNIDSVLDDIETRVDGLETLQTSTNTKLDTIETTLNAIQTTVDSSDQKLDNFQQYHYGTGTSEVDTLTMTNGDLTKTQALDTNTIAEIETITIVGETTANRTITVSIVISGTNLIIGDIQVNLSSTLLFGDSQWDQIRSIILALHLNTTNELRFVASGVTASESIIVNIGFVHRNT